MRLLKQLVVVAAIALAGSRAVAAVDGNTPLTLLFGLATAALAVLINALPDGPAIPTLEITTDEHGQERANETATPDHPAAARAARWDRHGLSRPRLRGTVASLARPARPAPPFPTGTGGSFVSTTPQRTMRL
jgi:hypothetical protein